MKNKHSNKYITGGLVNEKYCNTTYINKYAFEEIEPLLNFLFIVCNDIEMDEMFKILKPIEGYNDILIYKDTLGSKQSVYIGKFFKYNIALAKTADMGYSNINSVINVLNSLITVIKPRFIIMPGIAAGLDDNIEIGDVVVANKICGYESEKRKINEIIGRYPEFRSPRLYNLFDGILLNDFNEILKQETEELSKISLASDKSKEKNILFSWGLMFKEINATPKMHKGIIISGEKLLDDPLFRGVLRHQHKEALALDMEGLGIASASIFNRVYDWVVIKGISDKGDGNKGKNKTNCQIYAMKNVIRILMEVFDDETAFCSDEMKVDYCKYKFKKVLISSSQCKDGENFEYTPYFISRLAMRLIEENIKVISGYGLGVGPELTFGIYEGLSKKNIPVEEYSAHYSLFPFPRDNNNTIDKKTLDRYKNKNREMLCNEAKIFIFAFGQKIENEKLSEATGMFKELECAIEKKALIIPIAATGGTAKKIYDEATSSENVAKYFKPYFDYRKDYFGSALNEMDSYLRDLKGFTDKFNKINENGTDVKDRINEIIEKIIDLIKKYN